MSGLTLPPAEARAVVDLDVSICVLLDSPVTYNGRVQRTVRTLSRFGRVVLVTTGGSPSDRGMFDDAVEVRTTERPALSGMRKWLLLHRQNDHLADAALADGRDFDIVWANDYSTLFPARRIARETGATLIYDSHELWVETVNQFFPAKAPLPKALAFRMIVGLCRAIGNREEPKLVEDVDVVITANESYATVLRKRFRRDDVGVVLCCPERTEVQSSDRIRRELGLAATDRIVLYQGMMNQGRGLAELIMCAPHLPDGVRLVMLGFGPLEGSLREMVRDAGLEDRVLMPGAVPQAELHEWTASADIGVLILDPINLSKRLALGNKVFEYMSARVPILTTDLPENRRIVNSCECGWLLASWEPPVIAEQLSRILEDPEEMKRRGANGRRCFEERYNWECESQRLIAHLDGVLPGDTGADR
jgi:glycosyltransferase involved in cell wall biosynthesis